MQGNTWRPRNIIRQMYLSHRLASRPVAIPFLPSSLRSFHPPSRIVCTFSSNVERISARVIARPGKKPMPWKTWTFVNLPSRASSTCKRFIHRVVVASDPPRLIPPENAHTPSFLIPNIFFPFLLSFSSSFLFFFEQQREGQRFRVEWDPWRSRKVEIESCDGASSANVSFPRDFWCFLNKPIFSLVLELVSLSLSLFHLDAKVSENSINSSSTRTRSINHRSRIIRRLAVQRSIPASSMSRRIIHFARLDYPRTRALRHAWWSNGRIVPLPSFLPFDSCTPFVLVNYLGERSQWLMPPAGNMFYNFYGYRVFNPRDIRTVRDDSGFSDLEEWGYIEGKGENER